MEDLYKDNADYKLIFESKVHNIKFYAPNAERDYHMSRYAAAAAQNIYASSGLTKDLLERMIDKLLESVNQSNKTTLRSDVSTICNNMKYRLKYPVDEDCALRMGATFAIAQYEASDRSDYVYLDKKVKMAKGDEDYTPDPDLYAFFLTMGIEHTPAWNKLDKNTLNTEYFKNRRENLRGLTIPSEASPTK